MKKIKQFALHIFNRKKCCFGRKAIIDKRTIFIGKNHLGCFATAKNSKIGWQSYIGDYSHIDNTVIGNFSCISHHVVVVQGQHPTNQFVSIHPSFFDDNYSHSYVKNSLFDNYRYIDNVKKIACIIGNDVWVGYGALIMAGVSIGDGAIIAAGAVVTKDVEPYSIVGGVPAKLIKKRFTDSQIDFLSKINWWDKDEKWIKENAASFNSIDQFILLQNAKGYKE